MPKSTISKRTNTNKKPGRKYNKWSDDEKQYLASLVLDKRNALTVGTTNWDRVARLLNAEYSNERTPGACAHCWQLIAQRGGYHRIIPKDYLKSLYLKCDN